MGQGIESLLGGIAVKYRINILGLVFSFIGIQLDHYNVCFNLAAETPPTCSRGREVHCPRFDFEIQAVSEMGEVFPHQLTLYPSARPVRQIHFP